MAFLWQVSMATCTVFNISVLLVERLSVIAISKHMKQYHFICMYFIFMAWLFGASLLSVVQTSGSVRKREKEEKKGKGKKWKGKGGGGEEQGESPDNCFSLR